MSTADSVVGPAPQVSVDMVYDCVKKMKSGKAAGPSGVVSEMLIAGGVECVKVVADLINSIIRDGKVPKDWEYSYIVSLYKGKGDALCRENYRGLKLLEHIMKVLEGVVEKRNQKHCKHWRYAVWFYARTGHNRCYIHCKTTAGKVSCKK